MINLIERDLSRRKQACKYELSRLTLKSIIENRSIGEQERFRAVIKLSGLPRNSSRTRLRNRCVFTGRGRAVYRFCKLSRIELRRLAGAGKLPGITKSSW
ncbi:30S ribosomal protein S14 [bacterium]|nr:MAG: 30S ribosomal protein S14 [bacterium]